MSSKSAKEVLLTELGHTFGPVIQAVKATDDPDERFADQPLVEFLDAMGLGTEVLGSDWGVLKDELTTLTESANTLISATDSDGDISTGGVSIEDLLTEIPEVVDAIKGLSDIDTGDADVEDIGELIFDYLVIEHLEQKHPTIFYVLWLMGVAAPGTNPTPPELDPQGILDVFNSPENIPAEVLNWGSDEFLQELLLVSIHDALKEADQQAVFKLPNELPNSDTYYPELGVPEEDHSDGDGDREPDYDVPPAGYGRETGTEVPQDYLDVSVLSGTEDDGMGIHVVPLPDTSAKKPGFALIPFGGFSTDGSPDIGDDWSLEYEFSTNVTDHGLVLRPEETWFGSLTGGSTGDIHASAGIVHDAPLDEETPILGDPEGSRLAKGAFGAKTRIEYDGSELVFDFGLPTTWRIVVDPEDLGGFLKKVLPADGIDTQIDLEPGYTLEGGWYLETGGTLEISMPQNTELGPITLTEIYLAATLEDGTTTITAAVSGDVELGPVLASVGRVGISADVSFPEDRDGNLGIVDFDAGFEPPSKIGLSIDSGPVTGGGFLGFDSEHDRYSGILHLQFSQISITAIGLITTSLPGGEDGYSLLILITAQDLGVDIGMGFTLDGIGGLIGVHRSMQPKPLQRAVRTGSLSNVLFPEDPIANAQQIISDLRSIFPPTKGQFVIGPMLRIGWGKPTLITADIGVVLQLPKVRIAILGRISAALPDEAAPLVELNMDALGLILPNEKRMSLDATLYDSRLLVFNLSGQMAMRSRWGDDPRFILCVGGFHPEFDPPGEFPDVDRLKVSLSEGPFHVEISGYFSITSNTVQTGAHARVQLGSGKWKIAGHLGFDALIRWAPEFGFRADFIAEIEVCAGFCFSLSLEGTLMGVSPYKIKAKIKFSLGLFDVKIPVKASFGPDKDEEGLAPAKVLPELLDDLADPHSWETRLPTGTTDVVTLRDVEPDEGEVLGHPLGTFAVRQETVPLGMTIDTYGNAKPSDFRHFEIGEVVLHPKTRDVEMDPDAAKDYFAPGEYLDMSDSEQMEADGYERKPAGVKIASEKPTIVPPEGERLEELRAETGDDAEIDAYATATRETTLAYETSIKDENSGNYGKPRAELGRYLGSRPQEALFGIPAETAIRLSSLNAVAQADTRETGMDSFKESPLVFEGRYDDSGSESDSDGQSEGDDLSVELGSPDRNYVISRTDELTEEDDLHGADPSEEPVTYLEATQDLQRHLEDNPEDAGDYQVVPRHRITVGGDGG